MSDLTDQPKPATRPVVLLLFAIAVVASAGLIGNLATILASTAFEEGSPQRMRLLFAMSSSLTCASVFVGASPRNWRRHSRAARSISDFTQPPTLALRGWPVGAT